MRYSTSKKFDKQFSKLSKSVKEKAIARLQIFIQDPFETVLNNHPLNGKFSACRSINITADIRAVYKTIEKDLVYFVAIGSHSELYK